MAKNVIQFICPNERCGVGVTSFAFPSLSLTAYQQGILHLCVRMWLWVCVSEWESGASDSFVQIRNYDCRRCLGAQVTFYPAAMDSFCSSLYVKCSSLFSLSFPLSLSHSSDEVKPVLKWDLNDAVQERNEFLCGSRRVKEKKEKREREREAEKQMLRPQDARKEDWLR